MTEKSLYLDDLSEGQVFTSPRSVTMDVDSVRAFAAQFDPQPFHLDGEAAKSSFFGELVASGWHTAAATMRLITETIPLADGAIGAGVEEMKWPRPVKPGDELRLEARILEIHPSKSKPDRAIVKARLTTTNQHGEPVQTMLVNMLAFRRRG